MSGRRALRTDEDVLLEGLKSAIVLMADDEPTTLDVLEMFLHAEGYRELIKVADPRKVLPMISGVQPDVVLLNLMMPQVSGLDILAALRDDADLSSIPTIIITGSSDAKLKRQAFELGATDFLAKPIDPSELALRLRNTLATRAYRDGEPPRSGHRGKPEGVFAEPTDQADRIRTILDTFLSRLQPRVEGIEASLEIGDLVGVAELAHWLKGAAGTVGLHDFTAPAEALGRLARNGQVDEMKPIVETLRRMAADARRDADG